MNLLLIASHDISTEALERLHEAFDASIFLAGSLEEGLALARSCAFHHIVMTVRNTAEVDGLRRLVSLQPAASVLVYESTEDIAAVTGNITLLRSLDDLLAQHHNTNKKEL